MVEQAAGLERLCHLHSGSPVALLLVKLVEFVQAHAGSWWLVLVKLVDQHGLCWFSRLFTLTLNTVPSSLQRC